MYKDLLLHVWLLYYNLGRMTGEYLRTKRAYNICIYVCMYLSTHTEKEIWGYCANLNNRDKLSLSLFLYTEHNTHTHIHIS